MYKRQVYLQKEVHPHRCIPAFHKIAVIAMHEPKQTLEGISLPHDGARLVTYLPRGPEDAGAEHEREQELVTLE